MTRDGMRVTATVRSIADAAQLGTAPEQVIAAATQAVDRGMATVEQLLAAARERGGRVERLEQRLLDRSRATGESLVRLRKTVVFDRLLARPSAAAAGRWCSRAPWRSTSGSDSADAPPRTSISSDETTEEAATSDLLAAQTVDRGDFFVFSVEKVGRPQGGEGDAIRYRVRAELGGRLFEEVLAGGARRWLDGREVPASGMSHLGRGRPTDSPSRTVRRTLNLGGMGRQPWSSATWSWWGPGSPD